MFITGILLTYWFKYRDLGDLVISAPQEAFDKIKYSIRYEEYSLFPVVFLLPAKFLLGDSRLAYVLSNSVVYTFPAIFLFSYFFKMMAGKKNNFKNSDIGFLLAMIFYGVVASTMGTCVLWLPGGGWGVAIAYCVLIIYFRKPFSDQDYLSVICMALLLCLMVIFRRWYVYWVVGFLLSISIVNIALLFKEHRFHYRKYLPVTAKLAVLGGFSFLFFFLFATPQAKIMLTTDYADIYSGYKITTSFIGTLACLKYHFGLLTLGSAVMGFLFSLLHSKSRKVALVLFLQFWLSLIVFTRTQDLGYHHYYILLPSICLFSWLFFL